MDYSRASHIGLCMLVRTLRSADNVFEGDECFISRSIVVWSAFFYRHRYGCSVPTKTATVVGRMHFSGV